MIIINLSDISCRGEPFYSNWKWFNRETKNSDPLISRFLQLILGVFVSVFVSVALAHHSPVAFNTEITDFTLKGEIVSVNMRNPHSALLLRVLNDDGTEVDWDLELSSINLLLRRGWDLERLKVGEQIICVGNPSALGKHEMYVWSVEMSDGTEFGR